MISGKPLGADLIAKNNGVYLSLSSNESSISYKIFLFWAADNNNCAYLV